MARRKTGKPKVTPDLGKPANRGHVPMTKSGFCQFGPSASHSSCTNATCTCNCHTKEAT